MLEASCGADTALTAPATQVAASPVGVAMGVSSTAAAGATPRRQARRPGRSRLRRASCSSHVRPPTPDRQGAHVAVAVVDPHGYWSDLTLDDLGCALGGTPGWIAGGGTGATPEDAIRDLLSKLGTAGMSPDPARFERAAIGYPDSPHQTWILGTADSTYMTAAVTRSGSTYTADPDLLCEPAQWSTGPAADPRGQLTRD